MRFRHRPRSSQVGAADLGLGWRGVMELHFTNLLIVVAVGFAARSRSGWPRGCGCPRSCWRSCWDRHRAVGSRLGRDRRAVEVLAPDRARLPALPRRARDRLRPAARPRRCDSPGAGPRSPSRWRCRRGGLKGAGFVSAPLLVAIILLCDLARGHHPGAKDAGQLAVPVRSAGHRRRLDRRLRRDHPALDLLLGRGRARDAGPDRRTRALAVADRPRVAGPAPAPSGRTWGGSRTRPRRSACAARCCCWSASRRSPRRSGSR